MHDRPEPATSGDRPQLTASRDRPQSTTSRDGIRADHLPYGVVVAAGWAWRLIVIAIAVGVVVYAVRSISVVAVPLAVAVLLAVLLMPFVQLLVRRTPLRRGLAAVVAVLTLLVGVVGILALVGAQISSEFADLRASVETGLDQVEEWLQTGPLQLTGAQLADYLQRAREAVTENSSALTSGALNLGNTAAHFLAGLIIALIATYFYLAQGERMWRFLVRLLPAAAHEPVYQASRRGWVSLGSYARTQVLVAGVDALGIGLGAFILGLPFVIPIILLVFVASFIPIVGAVGSGAVVVLVALVVKGWVAALIMLGIVLLVQQVEAHILQPFLLGRAVSLHPLVVIVAVGLGAYLLGIVGALFAVPAVALGNTMLRYLGGADPFPDLAEDPMPSYAEDHDHAPNDGEDHGDDPTQPADAPTAQQPTGDRPG